VLVYLLGSRYCETDKLRRWHGRSSASEPGYPLLKAFWIITHDRITFGYPTPARRTASEAMPNEGRFAATSRIWRSHCAV